MNDDGTPQSGPPQSGPPDPGSGPGTPAPGTQPPGDQGPAGQEFEPGDLTSVQRRRVVKAVARYLYRDIRDDMRREHVRKLGD